MLEFQRAEKDKLGALVPYIKVQRTHISDFSLGFQYMWNDHLKPDYAIAGGCLVLREFYTGKYYYHYPISLSGSEDEEIAAISAIEEYCRDHGDRLHFTNVPRDKMPILVERYCREVTVTNARRWRDYLYYGADFAEYAGKKYAGQRNHVHKFVKNYPDWRFRPYTAADEPAVRAFLAEYERFQRNKHHFLAEKEMTEVYDVLPHFEELGIFGGVLEVGGKIVGFTAGEVCGDMIVVHIEKALREYEGAYPMLAQQFAKLHSGEAVYFNRMDDAGDRGLRKSKMQYLPCEIVGKYNILPKRAIDGVSRLPTLTTERLKLCALRAEDIEDYARLAGDTERNRYWGYDWRCDYHVRDCDENGTHVGGNPPATWFVSLARDDFKQKREMPLAVYAEGRLVGEVVLHRFGYRDEVEVGVRLLPEAEGKGYAGEAVRAYAEYAFMTLGLERVEAKCYRENGRSRKMLLSAGMRELGEDETFYYFEKTAQM